MEKIDYNGHVIDFTILDVRQNEPEVPFR